MPQQDLSKELTELRRQLVESEMKGRVVGSMYKRKKEQCKRLQKENELLLTQLKQYTKD